MFSKLKLSPQFQCNQIKFRSQPTHFLPWETNSRSSVFSGVTSSLRRSAAQRWIASSRASRVARSVTTAAAARALSTFLVIAFELALALATSRWCLSVFSPQRHRPLLERCTALMHPFRIRPDHRPLLLSRSSTEKAKMCP